MATSISIGYFNKKVNSTACDGFSGTDFSCVLKEGCDIKNPIVQVKGSFGNYNYAKWSSRYYWVDRVVSFPNGIFEAHMHLDPLATYKSDIFNTKAYTSYNSILWDPEVPENRLNPEIISNKSVLSANNIFDSTPTPSNGSVVVTCFEAGLGTANQGVRTYVLSISEFMTMIQNITTSLYDAQYNTLSNNSDINSNLANFTGPDDVANMIGALGSVALHDILKGLSDLISKIGGYGSWRDNLIKAVYVPFTKASFTTHGNPKNIHLGFLDTQQSASIVYPADVKTKTTSVQIPWDGLCTTYHWLKYNRFSKMQVICCGGQFTDLDTDLIRETSAGDSLSVHTAVDVCSGDWSAVLTKDSSLNSQRLASFGGNLGIDITGYAGKGLGMGMNYTQAGFKMAANILSQGLSSNAGVGESAAAIGTGIASQYLQNNMGNNPSGMSAGGISSIFLNGSTGYNDLSLVGFCAHPSILDSGSDYDKWCHDIAGYPSNRYVTLSGCLGGFVKCENASVSCQGTQSDIAFINNTLNSGCYIED